MSVTRTCPHPVIAKPVRGQSSTLPASKRRDGGGVDPAVLDIFEGLVEDVEGPSRELDEKVVEQAYFGC